MLNRSLYTEFNYGLLHSPDRDIGYTADVTGQQRMPTPDPTWGFQGFTTLNFKFFMVYMRLIVPYFHLVSNRLFIRTKLRFLISDFDKPLEIGCLGHRIPKIVK